MKTTQTLSLLTVSVSILCTAAPAQTTPTTPTGTATSTTYPTGAVAPDSTPTSGKSRAKGRSIRRSRNGATGGTTDAGGRGTGNAGYRQSSAANGTAVNSSNTTNYNTNNATNAPTGVGSNPSTSTPPASTPTTAPPGDQRGAMSSGSTNVSDGTAVSTSGATRSGATGTGRAVSEARKSEAPAVVAGSTVRNTSIRDFIASSPNYLTLQNAIQATDLTETLAQSGSFTLFAPSNTAFKKIPATLQNKLLEGQNRDALKQLLSYHVVAGTVDATTLRRQIDAGNGKAELKTLNGGTLTARAGASNRITLTDEQGKTATVDVPDQLQANGVVHGIDAVLMPKSGTGSFH